MFDYIHQPPSNTLNCCNPFLNGYITIVLECVVKYQTNEFEIRWFRENTTGAVEDLGHGNPNRSQENIMRWFSWYHEKDFFNQQYNPSYLGKYWCQVINTTADPDQPLLYEEQCVHYYWLLRTTLNQHALTRAQQYKQWIIQHVLITLNCRPHYLLLPLQ